MNQLPHLTMASQGDTEMKSKTNSNKQAEDNAVSNPKASIQDTLQVKFTTQIADKSMQCDDTIYALTSKLHPNALSQVVNHVLGKDKSSEQTKFDFLIKNNYVQSSLAEHLSENEISSEQTIEIEYIEKTIEPSAKSSDEHPDWVSCVDAIKSNTFITGCYDGFIRVWKLEKDNKTKTNAFVQVRGHIAPIKGIVALYSVISSNNVYYFASVGKDRSVKVFGLNETTRNIKQVSAIDVKSSKASHRFSVECCSAPYPSKVFATGSVDREIKIYRLRNKDHDINDSGPAKKKRKLNENMEMDVEEKDEKNGNDKKENDIEWSNLHCVSTLRGHRDAVKCLDWTNAVALYSGSWDACIKLWDVRKEIDTYTWTTQSAVHCLRYWLGQNVLISAHSNQKINIWDPRTDRMVQTKQMSKMTFRSHRLPITGIDVDGSAGNDERDGGIKNSEYLFITSSHDGKLKIWDIRSKMPLYTVSKHKGKALCVGWYGNTIVSGGDDCKLHSFKWSK